MTDSKPPTTNRKHLELDLIGELLQQQRTGSPAAQHDATRELLHQAADHLADSGTIPDMRLRCWLVDHLNQQAEAVPQPPGRQSTLDVQVGIALQVELARARGLSLTKAVIHVMRSYDFEEDTVRQYHKRFRPAALESIKQRGPRLPAKGGK
jgi:hypothetical protein